MLSFHKFTPALTTTLRSTVMIGNTIAMRCNSSVSKQEPKSTDELAFNKEFKQKDYDENIKEESEFEHSHDGGKSHIKHNIEGFKDLQDKGEKTAQEQERPEDFM